MEIDHQFVEPSKPTDNSETKTQSNADTNTVLPEALTHLSPADGLYVLDQLKNGAIVCSLVLSAARVTIGRSRDCDVVLDHPSVSRYHSVLLWTPQNPQQYINGENRDSFWYLVDCGSTHGTVCNKQPVIAGKMIKLVANNNIFKFGASTRLFTLRSNDTTLDDEDDDNDDHNDVELSDDSTLKQTKALNVEIGCNWGIDDNDAKGDNEETADSKALQAIISAMKDNDNNNTLNENAYSANPQKSIQHWFEREGYDIDYKVDSIHNKFKCTIELPIDGQWIPVEGTLTHRKKESIADTCLKCCQLLDRAELLFPWQQTAKREQKRRDSDSDSESDMIDETVQNAIKIKKMKNNDASDTAASFDSLNQSWTKVNQELQQLKSRLVSIELERTRNVSDMEVSEDPLDTYMSNIGQQKYGLSISDKLEKSQIKMKIKTLEKEQTKLEKLMKLTKPSFATNDSHKQTNDDFDNNICLPVPVISQDKSVDSNTDSNSININSVEKVLNDSEELKMCKKRTDSDVSDTSNKQTNTRQIGGANLSTNESKSNDSIKHRMKSNAHPNQLIKSQSIITTIENEKKLQSAKQKNNYDADYVDWVPPDDQCGDGKTFLNSKFGY